MTDLTVMHSLATVDPATATGKTKQLLDAVKASLNIIPNMTRVMANSSAVLEGFLSFSGAMASGLLDAKLREQIALAVAELNSCEYCVSAHSALAKMVGLSDHAIQSSREGKSDSSKTTAALQFVREIVITKGRVSTAEFNKIRNAGFNDGEIAELIANTAMNIFTNYFNSIAGVEVDFPRVAWKQTA
jgi:uncharacterized peroxidase-related enzyme